MTSTAAAAASAATSESSINVLEQKQRVTGNPPSKRVVYIEDELGDDDFGVPFSASVALDTLPDLACSNACNEEVLASTLSSSEPMCNSSEAAFQPEGCTSAVACAPLTPTPEFYELARPQAVSPQRQLVASASVPAKLGFRSVPYYDRRNGTNIGLQAYSQDIFMRTLGARSKKKPSYAKFLLESERELERMANKIRSEIRQAEMVELALEAERAANSGAKSFHGRASTFGEDADLNEKQRNTLQQQQEQDALFLPLRLRRHRTFTEGVGLPSRPLLERQHRKIRVLALRDISEVIPQFSELHLHMKLHLTRERVSEKCLSLRGPPQQLHGCRWVSTPPEQEQLQTVDCAGMAAVAMFKEAGLKQQLLQRSLNRWAKLDCDELKALDRIADDSSEHSSDASVTSEFGITLSSHLSPKKVRRPRVRALPGLSLPIETTSSVAWQDRTKEECQLEKPVNTSRSFFSEDSEQSSKYAHPYSPQRIQPEQDRVFQNPSTDQKGDSPCRFREEKKDTASDMDLESLVSLHAQLFPDKLNASSRALFDNADDSGSSRGASPEPPLVLEETSELPGPVPLTPKNVGWSRHGGSDFVTPARLRDIRGHRQIKTMSNVTSTPPHRREAIATPDAMRFSFEPSSIIDSGKRGGNPGHGGTKRLKEDQARFLALPSIQDVPNEIFNPIGRKPESAEKRLVYPRRSDESNQFGVGESDFIPMPTDFATLSGPLQPTDVVQNLARDNPADSSASSVSSEDVGDESNENSPHKTVYWNTKEKPLEAVQQQVGDPEFSSLSIAEQPKRDEREEVASVNSLMPREDPPPSPIEKLYPRPDRLLTFSNTVSTPQMPGQRFEEANSSQRLNRRLVFELDASAKHDKFHHVEPVPLEQRHWNLEQSLSGPVRPWSPLAIKNGYKRNPHLKSKSVLPYASTWAGRFSRNSRTSLRRSMSCSDMDSRALQINAAELFGCNSERINDQRIIANSASLLDQFARTDAAIFMSQSDSMSNSSRPASPVAATFKTAINNVIAGLGPRKDVQKSECLSDIENKEFLNNYFYCSRPDEPALLDETKDVSIESAACVEPCNAGEALCQAGDLDNVCASFTFLFASDNSARTRPTPVLGTSERTLSLGREGESELESETWLSLFGLGSNRLNFGLSRRGGGGGIDDNSSERFHHLKPPCLKKTGTSSSSKRLLTNHSHVQVLGSTRQLKIETPDSGTSDDVGQPQTILTNEVSA